MLGLVASTFVAEERHLIEDLAEDVLDEMDPENDGSARANAL
jgi:hypothetical protein